MAVMLPKPGSGFRVREYLGGGNWKSAYRATSSYSLSDVALLFFHENNPDIVLEDIRGLLQGASKHKYSGYLAQLYGLYRAPDERWFIVEELLARPLDGISPLNDLVQFVRVGRDLCRGLTCLHENNLVHRDLKLDNCGLDHQKRAKIFDLGSVTSDGGDIRGTVLTRAPELFLGGQCDFGSDIWALGATLFALRTGEYPFVLRSEVKAREKVNEAIRSGTLSESDGRERKEKLNHIVEQRIQAPKAEGDLRERVHSNLRGRYAELLLSMLDFSKQNRLSASEYEKDWTLLAEELSGKESANHEAGKWDKIRHHVSLAANKEIVLTRGQIDKIIFEYQHEKPNDPDDELATTLKKIKEIS